jgi:hypothetical protein
MSPVLSDTQGVRLSTWYMLTLSTRHWPVSARALHGASLGPAITFVRPDPVRSLNQKGEEARPDGSQRIMVRLSTLSSTISTAMGSATRRASCRHRCWRPTSSLATNDRRPPDAILNMCKLITVLLSPAMLLLLILGTRPEGIEWNLWLAVAVYAFAHVLFWPPWFATRYVATRLRIQSLVGMASLMGGASVVIWLPAALVMLGVHRDPTYGWREVVRDSGSLGVASASAYFLYSALSSVFGSATVRRKE